MTDELKNKLANAKTEEEAKAILAEYKGELTEDELETIVGGNWLTDIKNAFKETGDTLKRGAEGVMGDVKDAFKKTGDALEKGAKETWNDVKNIF